MLLLHYYNYYVTIHLTIANCCVKLRAQADVISHSFKHASLSTSKNISLSVKGTKSRENKINQPLANFWKVKENVKLAF